MITSKEQVDMKQLPMSEKAKLATMLGEEVGKVLNRALSKCNKILKKYGYSVSVTLNFHELDDNKDN
jgi:hypothetical protein